MQSHEFLNRMPSDYKLIELNSSSYSQNKINPNDPHFISNRNQNKDDKGNLNKSNY